MTHAHSSFKNMDAAKLGALAAAQKDGAGPTMMFAKVGVLVENSEGAAGSGEGDGDVLSKEGTENVGGILQQVRAAAQYLAGGRPNNITAAWFPVEGTKWQRCQN